MKCPYCAEEIKDDAIVCRYYHRDLAATRLQSLETKVVDRIKSFEKELLKLSKRIEYLENAQQSGLITSREKSSYSGMLLLLVASVIVTGSMYLIVRYNIIGLLLLPVCIIITVGIQAGSSLYNRTLCITSY